MLEAATGLSRRDRARGCLLAGACGDALGAPVEFMRDGEIRARFGPGGIRDFVPAYGKLGAITDDTQMTLFTAEGLIRAHLRRLERGTSDPVAVTKGAYLRWLLTQGARPRQASFPEDGWLLGLRELHDRRAPGNTCLSALVETPGEILAARNDSKGCGGVMRAAPAGLAASRSGPSSSATRARRSPTATRRAGSPRASSPPRSRSSRPVEVSPLHSTRRPRC